MIDLWPKNSFFVKVHQTLISCEIMIVTDETICRKWPSDKHFDLRYFFFKQMNFLNSRTEKRRREMENVSTDFG